MTSLKMMTIQSPQVGSVKPSIQLYGFCVRQSFLQPALKLRSLDSGKLREEVKITACT